MNVLHLGGPNDGLETEHPTTGYVPASWSGRVGAIGSADRGTLTTIYWWEALWEKREKNIKARWAWFRRHGNHCRQGCKRCAPGRFK